MSKTRTVTVWVVKRGNREKFVLRWNDPVTRRRRERVSEHRRRRDAERDATALEHELNAALHAPEETSWDEFVDVYRDNHLKNTSRDNRYKWNAVDAIFREVAHERGVRLLEDITPKLMKSVESKMRERLAEGSISSYMATLRAGLSFAAEIELMPPLPKARKRGREEVLSPVQRMRPITMEDMEKMAAAAKHVVGLEHAPGWERYVKAMWLSGCRMREPLMMHWRRQDCHRPFGLDTDKPKVAYVSSQKNRRDQVARITMDFAEFLRSIAPPGDHPDGFIFPLTTTHGPVTFADRTKISKVISAIGKHAKVIVEPHEEAPVYATAKHFRPSFGTRWALRGMPVTLLQNIMRHADQQTTLKYYVGRTSDMEWSDANWPKGDQSCDQRRKSSKA